MPPKQPPERQPQPEFDPHPGDPWHPAWTLDPVTVHEEPEADEPESSWWRRALYRKDESGSPSAVPSAYTDLAHAQATSAGAVDVVAVGDPLAPSIDFGALERQLASAAGKQTLRLMESEDARMQLSIAAVRAEFESLMAEPPIESGTAEEKPPQKKQPATAEMHAAWARQAEKMRAATERFEERRREVEAEVRSVLDRQLPQATPVASETTMEPGEAGDRFATMAARMSADADTAKERQISREVLRMQTKLAVLEADTPWVVSRRNGPGTLRAPTRPRSGSTVLAWSGNEIAKQSVEPVPESTPRRRRLWSRTKRDAASNRAPRVAEPAVRIEERPMTDRDDDLGADLEAWSDLDWGVESLDPIDEVNDESRAEEPFDIDYDVQLFGTPEAPEATPASPEDSDDDFDADWEQFTAEQYVQTATQEYADLAAAVAAAEAEETEQAALAADMPGFESSLVSLDDVVAAEGLEPAEAAPERSDLTLRVLTAVGLVALFIASLFSPVAIGVLILVVMMLAAGELATSLRRSGHHPVTLFSFLGTAGALLGTWAFGPIAIPVAVAATLVAVPLFYALVSDRVEPLTGMALTVMVVLWVGGLAGFAMDLVNAPEYQWLIAGFVITVAAMDVAQYFVGKQFGKRPLAPLVSPKKTVAGLVGGIVTAIAVGCGLSVFAPFDLTAGAVLGSAVAVTGPVGDLAVSVLKRSLGVKDMGTILPGHGGVVDRIDAILFSIPAAWLVYAWAGLLG